MEHAGSMDVVGGPEVEWLAMIGATVPQVC